MCVVSMIGDHYNKKFNEQWPDVVTFPSTTSLPPISREEFELLKADVAEMKELLKKAKIYDEENNQADCEMEEKLQLLRKIAEMVGVDLEI